MKKHLICFLLIFAILLSVLPAVSAEESYFLRYNVYENGDFPALCITGYGGTLPEKLVIPEEIDGYPVCNISDRAFQNAQIREVVLPGTIEELITPAFSGNETLEAVTIGEGTRKVAEAFSNCSKLKTAILPSTLEELGQRAFSQTDLQTLIFGGSVKRIDSFAFYNTPLTELRLPEGLEDLAGWALSGMWQLEKVYLPSTLQTVGECLFGYNFDLSPNLSVCGYCDTPILDYCLNAGIPFVDAQTQEPVPGIYKTEVEGVTYRVDPVKKTASIVGCDPDKLPPILIIPDTVEGCAVTKIESWGLENIRCSGLILPDTMTYIADLGILPANGFWLSFIGLPNNEVYIERELIHEISGYLFLPPDFSIAEKSGKEAWDIFRYSKCIGYEKHMDYVDPEMMITLTDPNSHYLLSPSGVFRLDGEELTAIYLQKFYPMPSTVGEYPVTRIAASCEITAQKIAFGEYVRVVEDGALLSVDKYGEDYIHELYVPESVEYLPSNLANSFYITLTVYGKTGSYAEQYASEHGFRFYDKSKTPFVDVSENAWYFTYVHDVYWNHFMNGTGETTFEPNATTTRAMVMQVLYNMSGVHYVATERYFSDVFYTDWFIDAVTWAYLSRIGNGTGAATFSPYDPVTREQLAAFLYRFAQGCGYTCKVNGNLSAFSDGGKISSYAKDAVSWAVGAGIINGKTENTIVPQGYATRAEIAAMLCRFLGFVRQNDAVARE